ncbi:MAG: CRTAC1 family protein, partial [Puniceicoccaceae bacterium]
MLASRPRTSASRRLRLIMAAALLGQAVTLAARVTSEPFAPPSQPPGDHPGFTRLTQDESGFTQVNTYRDPRAWQDRYLAATAGTVGSGLGVADFNGNGWPDVFIASREGQNRLYLNDQGRRFIDATEGSGILPSPDWTTGVTIVDINGNGLPDIYVCYFNAPNRLYVNQGDGTFTEEATAYGLAIRDASNAAFFADFTGDGRLDLFLQTNILDERHGGNGQPDRLFRNDGEAGFTEVTAAAGLPTGAAGATHGHSALWFDFNGNGREDLYVANDFATHDFLYLNNGDGTFTPAAHRLPVVPYSSMGSDLGDVNGNGLLDLLATDMATPSYLKHVESMLTNARKTYWLRPGSRPPMVMKNALLLQRSPGDFIDVAYAWGLAATDWTWTARLVDLDNSGWPDAAFTNGMLRQFHNADLSYRQDRMTTTAARNAVFRDSPVLAEANLLFRNRGGTGFEPANESWGFHHVGVSFAAVFFDFDRDGDLDILYTNYEEPPTLWRNDLGRGNAAQIRLVGPAPNTRAIGAVAIAHFGDRRQAQKILSNRGYLASDDPLLHFGLGDHDRIDRLVIHWPDGTVQEEQNLAAGHRHTITQAAGASAPPRPAPTPPARFARLDSANDETL